MGIFSPLGAFMAMQFEEHQGGYLYRANGRGPALAATREERDQFVRKGAVSFILHVAALMIAVIGAAMITAHWFPGGDEPGGFVLMGGLLLVIGYALYRSVRRSMLAPARALGDRPPVANAPPPTRKPFIGR